MKAMWQEFKDFAMRGNVVDLAIGVIIGAAFTPIVATLVANMIMPIIGYITAGVNFSTLAVTPVEGVEIKYGLFLNAIVQFLLTAVALFFLIKGINIVRQPKAAGGAPADAVRDLPQGDPRCPRQREIARRVRQPAALRLFGGGRDMLHALHSAGVVQW